MGLSPMTICSEAEYHYSCILDLLRECKRPTEDNGGTENVKDLQRTTAVQRSGSDGHVESEKCWKMLRYEAIESSSTVKREVAGWIAGWVMRR
ncbi:hypothetical protein RRG08_003281 [Elysia crispata]|uniref:Uncharacterized protein n=1 Tax=Elysia crispata TaxID=231223 RepID=A0AAE0YLQ5_9GAST|nr:hypothetical protein RRG08_003281 [Elysia crispata]